MRAQRLELRNGRIAALGQVDPLEAGQHRLLDAVGAGAVARVRIAREAIAGAGAGDVLAAPAPLLDQGHGDLVLGLRGDDAAALLGVERGALALAGLAVHQAGLRTGGIGREEARQVLGRQREAAERRRTAELRLVRQARGQRAREPGGAADEP